MAYTLLCYSKNSHAIFYDPAYSHAATHFADTPQLKGLVQEIMRNTITTGRPLCFETHVGKVAGLTDLVETDDTDDIVYAKRTNRDTYTRFTMSRSPRPSSIVTVSLAPRADKTYVLHSAWVGPVGHPFPDDPQATPASRTFWSSHALAWGTQKIQENTITTQCPW